MNFRFISVYARYFGTGPLLIACLLALTFTQLLWPKLARLPETYRDPVAGYITWSNVGKAVDMDSAVLLAVSTGVIALSITMLARATVSGQSEADLDAVNQMLLLSLIPAGYRLAAACVNDDHQMPPIQYLSLFPLIALASLVMLRGYRKDLVSSDYLNLGGAILLTPVMAGFSALAVTLAAARLLPGQVNKVAHLVAPTAKATIAISLLAIVVIWIVSPTVKQFSQRIFRCLKTAQYALPLLFFYLVPPPFIDATKQFHNPYPTRLVAAISVTVIFCIYRMWRRFTFPNIEMHRPLVKAVSPVSVAAMMVFIIGFSAPVPELWHDYFQLGELLVPWQQMWQFHSLPYVDFAPVHGLMELGYGLLNQVFFDGTAAGLSASKPLVAGLALGITGLAASELLTPLGALILLFACLPIWDRFYFLAAPLFIIAGPRLLRAPIAWLMVWLVVGALVCGYNEALGPAFVLATVPLAGWQTWRGMRTARLKLAALLLAVTAIAVTVYLIVPLRQIAFGFVNFALDNAWTNQAANGVAFSEVTGVRDQVGGYGSSQFLWETVRFGWIPISIAGAWLCWRQWSKPPGERNISAIVVASSIPLMLYVAAIWAIARIDSGWMTRSGGLALAAMFFLVPAMVLVSVSKKQLARAALLLAVFMGLISTSVPAATDPISLAEKSSAARIVDAGTGVIDGSKIGLPRIGQVVRPEPDWTVEILNMKKSLSTILKPDETFFDLANHTALYFFLGLRSPVQYGPYVACNSRLQAIMMRQLQNHPVPAVLIGGGPGSFNEEPMSLRCYRPYHDYVLKYTVLTADGWIFLVDPSRNPDHEPVGTESQLQVLDSIYRREDLLRLPIAWGESFKAMRDRFATIATVRMSLTAPAGRGTTPTLTWKIPPQAASGVSADFVRLTLNIDPVDPVALRWASRTDPPRDTGPEPQLSLTWAKQDGVPSAPIRFRGISGQLLIPLGAYPRWLLGSGFRTMTLKLDNPGFDRKITVTDIEFLRLKPL